MTSHVFSFPRVRTILFLLLWSATYAVGWALILASSETFNHLDEEFVGFVVAVVLGVPVIILQALLLRWRGSVPVRNWIESSLLGWILGAGVYWILGQTVLKQWYDAPVWFHILPFFTLAAAMQWRVLRRIVSSASLWVLAGAVSATTFAIFIESNYWNDFLTVFVVSALAQGAVTGLTLIWLLSELPDRPA
jgi:hypothetical protein